MSWLTRFPRPRCRPPPRPPSQPREASSPGSGTPTCPTRRRPWDFSRASSPSAASSSPLSWRRRPPHPTPERNGRRGQTKKEGNYRLRPSHARYTTEVRQIHVIGGNTSELRVRLAPKTAKGPPPTTPATTPPAAPAGKSTQSSSPPGSEVGRAVDEGVNAVKKIFR